MSIVALDCETGGLDPNRCPILSIGLVRLDDDLKPTDKLEIFIQPEPGMVIEAEAARVNGYTPERWRQAKAVPLIDAMYTIRAWLPGKPDILAHNAGFDKAFVAAAEKRTNQNLYLSYSWHCSMATFKAVNVAMQLGYTKASLDFSARAAGHWDAGYQRGDHGALEDALASAAVFRWCIQKMRDGLPGQRLLAS